MSKYVIGLDYGTLSGRAVVVDVKDGRQLASAVYEYPHAVMDRALPTGEKLPPDKTFAVSTVCLIAAVLALGIFFDPIMAVIESGVSLL